MNDGDDPLSGLEKSCDVMASLSEFNYQFHNFPWFFIAPRRKDIEMFDKGFHSASRKLFDMIRHGANITEHTIVAPHLGGLTAGELSLLWIQHQTVTKRKRESVYYASKKKNNELLSSETQKHSPTMSITTLTNQDKMKTPIKKESSSPRPTREKTKLKTIK